MVARQRERYFRNNSLNTYLNYELNTGALRHRILLGYDYFQMELKAGSSEMSKPVHICSKAELLPYLEAQQELAEIILMVGAGDIDRLVRPVIEYLKTK